MAILCSRGLLNARGFGVWFTGPILVNRISLYQDPWNVLDFADDTEPMAVDASSVILLGSPLDPIGVDATKVLVISTDNDPLGLDQDSVIFVH